VNTPVVSNTRLIAPLWGLHFTQLFNSPRCFTLREQTGFYKSLVWLCYLLKWKGEWTWNYFLKDFKIQLSHDIQKAVSVCRCRGEEHWRNCGIWRVCSENWMITEQVVVLSFYILLCSSLLMFGDIMLDVISKSYNIYIRKKRCDRRSVCIRLCYIIAVENKYSHCGRCRSFFSCFPKSKTAI